MLSAGGSANASAERGGYNGFPKIIVASAAVLVFVLFVSHPLGVLVAGRDRLGPERRRAAAAAAAVVAGAVDHMRLAFFLFDRVLHLRARHQAAA